jgi:hypothetical protein
MEVLPHAVLLALVGKFGFKGQSYPSHLLLLLTVVQSRTSLLTLPYRNIHGPFEAKMLEKPHKYYGKIYDLNFQVKRA